METLLLSELEIRSLPNNTDLGIYVRQKMTNQKAESYDACVLCGKASPYKRSTHIDCRIGYLEGAGQGCWQPKVCQQNYQPNNIDL